MVCLYGMLHDAYTSTGILIVLIEYHTLLMYHSMCVYPEYPYWCIYVCIYSRTTIVADSVGAYTYTYIYTILPSILSVVTRCVYYWCIHTLCNSTDYSTHSITDGITAMTYDMLCLLGIVYHDVSTSVSTLVTNSTVTWYHTIWYIHWYRTLSDDGTSTVLLSIGIHTMMYLLVMILSSYGLSSYL